MTSLTPPPPEGSSSSDAGVFNTLLRSVYQVFYTVGGTTNALNVPSVTTTERNAIKADNGMIVYNTTTNAFNFRENGAWVTK